MFESPPGHHISSAVGSRGCVRAASFDRRTTPNRVSRNRNRLGYLRQGDPQLCDLVGEPGEDCGSVWLKNSTLGGTIICVSKIRRGNYVFLTWSGDHLPRHVHVYKDREFVVKWNLDDWVAMEGEAPKRVIRLLAELVEEGIL